MWRLSLSVLGGVLSCAISTAIAQAPAGNPAASKMKNPVPSTKESIATGQELYELNCLFCHGPEGRGDGPLAPPGSMPANLVDDEWKHGSSDGEIFTVIQKGVGPDFIMPPGSERLSDMEIWNIVNYLRSVGASAGKP
jgi:mono/diheme cytochrome c family protein